MATTLTNEPRGHEHPDNGVGARAPRRVPAPGQATGRGLSLAGLLGVLAGLLGLTVGLGPLYDNSFLTHLATGRLILDTGSVPTVDPFSFTAPGEPWVVQSWLASVLYAGAEELFGRAGLAVLFALTGAGLGLAVWALTRSARSLLVRVAVAGLVFCVGAGMWSERPFMFGLLLLAAALLVAEGRADPRWLVPVMWVWVNVHGSFPLGLVALAALALGRRLDGEHPVVELRALRWAGLGTLLAAVNPLGPKLLTFPLDLLARQEILRNVTEWQAPRFVDNYQRVFLLFVMLAVVALVRRPSWRAALPLVVFVPAALLSLRNLPVATLVLLPGLSRGLTGFGTITGTDRRRVFRLAAMALVALGGLMVVGHARGPVFKFAAYPTEAVSWLQDEGLAGNGGRVVTQDFVGNYLEYRFGESANVYVDDRYDMYPSALLRDYVTLMRAGSGWDEALDRAEPDAVLWRIDAPLGQLLRLSPDWKIAWTDNDWLVAIPSG